jgi:hypothetical protein
MRRCRTKLGNVTSVICAVCFNPMNCYRVFYCGATAKVKSVHVNSRGKSFVIGLCVLGEWAGVTCRSMSSSSMILTEGHAVSHARPERTSGGMTYTKVLEELTSYVFGVEGWRWRLCTRWLSAHFPRKTVTFSHR